MALEWRWSPSIQTDNVITAIPGIIESHTINGLGAADFSEHKIPLRDGCKLTGRSEKPITVIIAGMLGGSPAGRTETACLAQQTVLIGKLRGNAASVPATFTLILYRQYDTVLPGWTANYLHFRDCTCEDTSFDISNITRDGIPFQFTAKSEASEMETGALPVDP